MKTPLPLLIALPAFAAAIEPRDTRGLSVVVEAVTGPLLVNGVPMHAVQARGPQVGQVAQRIAARWRDEKTPAQHLEHQGWKILSRWHGLRSEVVQWRGEGAEAQLLFSWFDISKRRRAPARAPLALPRQCAWTGSVEGEAPGGQYAQHLAHCRIDRAELAPELGAAITRQHWTVLRHGDGEWLLTRGSLQARVFVAPGATPQMSAVVWVSTPAGAAP